MLDHLTPPPDSVDPLPASKRTGSQPRYHLDDLKLVVGAKTDADLADFTGLTISGIRNLRQRGVTWERADTLAVACGYLPWEIWPDWALADPADWCNIPAECVASSHQDSHNSTAVAA